MRHFQNVRRETGGMLESFIYSLSTSHSGEWEPARAL